MALQAKGVHVAHIQQAGIGRAVWRMAGRAALGLDHWMLIGEGSGFLTVAVGADHILIGGCLQLRLLEGAMRVMAVSAAHQPLIDLVVKRLRKRRFDIGMAGVAELRLRSLEKIGRGLGAVNIVAPDKTLGNLVRGLARSFLRGMNAVAIRAAHPRLSVGGMGKIGMYPCMAAQAPGVGLLGGCRCEAKDLGRISA